MSNPSICPNCKHPMRMHGSNGCYQTTTVWVGSNDVQAIGCNCPTTPEDFDVHPLTEEEL